MSFYFGMWRCCLKGDGKPVKGKSKKGELKTEAGDNEAYEKSKTEGIEEGQEMTADSVSTNKDELEYSVDTADVQMVSPTLAPLEEPPEEMTETDAPSAENGVAPAPRPVQPSSGVGIVRGHGEISPNGRLYLTFNYEEKTSKLSVVINKVEFPPHQEWKLNDLEISCNLLPVKQQSVKTRSKKFNVPFHLYLTPRDKIAAMSLRFRLYDSGKVGKKHLIGQGIIPASAINFKTKDMGMILDLHSTDTYAIDSRYISSVPTSSSVAEAKPEILLSLEYRALTRKLIVELIKTRHVGMWTKSKPHDLCIEMKLFAADGSVLRICRTSVKHHVIDTEFNEMFMFRLTEERLKNVTLQVVLLKYSEVLGRKEALGEVSFGQQSTGEEQQNHWDDMCRAQGHVVVRWQGIFK